VLRYAHQIATETHSNLHIIDAIQSTDPNLSIQLDLDEQIQSEERQQVRQRIADLQRRIVAPRAGSDCCRSHQGGAA
jgi:hypothetical protein